MAWEIDPAHSEAAFALKHMMFTTVRGHFNVLSGHLHIDEEHPENSWVDAQADAAPGRYHTLVSKRFLVCFRRIENHNSTMFLRS